MQEAIVAAEVSIDAEPFLRPGVKAFSQIECEA